MFRKPKIKTIEQYNELAGLYDDAVNTLYSASTQGAHYLLIAFLKFRYGISTNGREEAMQKARQLLDQFDFGSCVEHYAEMADKL